MKNKLKVEKYINSNNTNILNIFEEDYDFTNFIKIKNKSYKKIHNSADKLNNKTKKNYYNRIIDIDED
jgi:hypothetical protein